MRIRWEYAAGGHEGQEGDTTPLEIEVGSDEGRLYMQLSDADSGRLYRAHFTKAQMKDLGRKLMTLSK